MKQLSDLKNPTQWFKIEFKEVDLYRFQNCVYYSECVEFAALRYWESFSCFDCVINKLKEKGK